MKSAPAQVQITINPIPEAPAVVNDTYATGEDAPLQIPAPGVLANDTNPDGDQLTATLIHNPCRY